MSWWEWILLVWGIGYLVAVPLYGTYHLEHGPHRNRRNDEFVADVAGASLFWPVLLVFFYVQVSAKPSTYEKAETARLQREAEEEAERARMAEQRALDRQLEQAKREARRAVEIYDPETDDYLGTIPRRDW